MSRSLYWIVGAGVAVVLVLVTRDLLTAVKVLLGFIGNRTSIVAIPSKRRGK